MDEGVVYIEPNERLVPKLLGGNTIEWDGSGTLHVQLDGVVRSTYLNPQVFPTVHAAIVALERQLCRLVVGETEADRG